MRTSRLLSLSLLTAAAGISLGVARADDLDVPALFASAKASYDAKHYGKALGDLVLVAGEVGRLRVDVLKTKVPAAPAGWTAEEAEGNAGMGWLALGGMSQVRRRYVKAEDTNASVQVEVYADAATMVAPFQMMLGNAAFMGNAMKVVTIKGRKALLQMQPEQKSGSLTVLLNTANSMLKLDGSGIAKADLDALAGAFDLDALEKAIAE